MKHVVMFSGGIGSWATAKGVAEKYGTSGLILLFGDTLIEEEDLCRFPAARLVEGEPKLGRKPSQSTTGLRQPQ